MAEVRRIEPGPGQESVWDYPRPPRVEPSRRRVKVVFAGRVVAESGRAVRVLETAGPLSYYVPPDDVPAPRPGSAAQSSRPRPFAHEVA